MQKPINGKPNVLPADVANLRDELRRLAATEKPDARVGESRPLARDIRAKAK